MQCIAITKEGKECTRNAEYGEYCWQHLRILEKNTVRSFIKSNEDMKITTDAEIFIDRIILKLLSELQVNTYEELFDIANKKYILSSGDEVFKALILSYFQNQGAEIIRMEIIKATIKLLFSEIRKLYKYQKVVNYELVVRSIALDTNLNNLFESYSVPQKYIIEFPKTKKAVMINKFIIVQEFLEYNLSDDFIRFLEKYINWNYNFVKIDRKIECGYTGDINQFFQKWANYIKPYLPKGKLIKYKEGTDLVLKHDFWEDCTLSRREEIKRDLGDQVVGDVLNNILFDYIT